MKFIKGETVRITDRFAAVRSKGSHLDWRGRIGTVKASSNYIVYVMWDGTTSVEALLLKAVERYERT